MKKILILLIIGIMFSSEYSVGETISLEHQYIEFPICYGEYENEQFKLADLNGELNGGNYKVIMIGMDATWCSPCFALIPDFDMIVQNWSENNDVFIFNALRDINQPYSCLEWGNAGTTGIPIIIDDGDGTGNNIFNLFNTNNILPSFVFIDYEMKVNYMSNQTTYDQANNIIETMLDDFYDNLENFINYEQNYEFNLTIPYPNPFNPKTSISFSIPKQSLTSIKVYDIKGNLISTLLNESINVGHHQIEWNADGFPSGVYFVKLDAGEFTQTQKLMLVK